MLVSVLLHRDVFHIVVAFCGVENEIKLKLIRNRKGLTQVQLAELSGVSLPMIQKYEIGVKDINKAQASTVKKLAIALECNMEDLID